MNENEELKKVPNQAEESMNEVMKDIADIEAILNDAELRDVLDLNLDELEANDSLDSADQNEFLNELTGSSENELPNEEVALNNTSVENKSVENTETVVLPRIDTERTSDKHTIAEKTSEPKEQKKKPIWIILTAALLIVALAAGFGVYEYNKITKDDGLILPNVEVNGIAVGGMTKAQFMNALTPLSDQITKTDMVIKVGEREVILSPSVTGAQLDLNAIYNTVYNYGRSGSKLNYYKAKKTAENSVKRISIYDYLSVDTQTIRNTIQATADAMNSEYKESSVKITGTKPALDLEHYDETVACQVIEITMGNPGTTIDVDKVYNDVINGYGTGVYTVTAEPTYSEPKAVDLAKIQKDNKVEAVDAKMDSVTMDITPESYGYDFDIEEAQKLLDKAKAGEVVKISFKYVEPKVTSITLKESTFPDVLFEYTTYQYSNYNRASNLRLACQLIDGTIIMPDDVFSFNDVVGERTYEKGYLDAIAYVNNKAQPDIGGGICQVATTIYYAALHCDFEIVERTEHMYPSDYVPYGMDATVYWGSLDMKFRNTSGHPIRIDAVSESDGYVHITIMGIDEKDYYVDIDYIIEGYIEPTIVYEHFTEENKGSHYDGEILQYPSDGIAVTTYRYRYDKQTNTLISKEWEAYSRYSPHDKIIVKIDNPTTDPSTEPSTDPSVDPSTDPSVDPSTTPSVDPSTDPSADPSTDPSTDPATDPSTDPATDPTTDPTTDPATDPTTDPATDPATDPTTDPTT